MDTQETKSRLLRAAAETISAQGYHNVSVREICEAAGVSKPVLYYYFKDKEDVLAELIKEGHLRLRELFDQYINPGSSFDDNLNGLYDVYLSYTDLYPHLIRISTYVQLAPLPDKIKSLSNRMSREAVELINPIFVKGIEEKYFDRKVELEMLVNSLIGPLGIFIAQNVLFRNNVKPLKTNLKKYFDFWKSHFTSKRIKPE